MSFARTGTTSGRAGARAGFDKEERAMRQVVVGALGALAAVLALAPVALAQSGEDIGQNAGELLSGWASALFMGVVAIVSIVFLINRKYTELLVFIVIAVVVGGFAIAPDSAEAAIRGIFRALTG
jgi:hypothetical protein